MPGRYASRATKFLYLDGAPMTGADGPLTKSESETEYLAEKYMPEGSARPVVVQSGLSNEMIALEGYARRDSKAANLILSDDAHALAATPERVVTVGDFGDIVGQKATVYHGMSLADGWKTIPGEILLQFSGTLKTARGGLSSVQEGTIVREMSRSTGETENNAQIRARYVDLGPASSNGFAVAYHVEEIHFRDRARLTVGLTHAVSATTNPTALNAANFVIQTGGAQSVGGPVAFWVETSGTARRFVAPSFAFGGSGSAANTNVTYHVTVVRL